MKIHLKRFLCAAMVAASSVFAGSVANAEVTQAKVTVEFNGKYHWLLPKCGTFCTLKINGESIKTKILDIQSQEVKQSESSTLYAGGIPSDDDEIVQYIPSETSTVYTITLGYDDSSAPKFMSHDASVRAQEGSKLDLVKVELDKLGITAHNYEPAIGGELIFGGHTGDIITFNCSYNYLSQ